LGESAVPVDEADHVGERVVEEMRLDLRLQQLGLRDLGVAFCGGDARPLALKNPLL
jgi:hypothetical protein